MTVIKTYGQAEIALAKFAPETPATTKYTLDAMKQLMAFLGNPQDQLRVVHIAGTSGKTSTCYFVASLLNSAGYSVGFSVSPHIDSISERAQLQGLPFGEAVYCQELTQFLVLVSRSGVTPSYFEVLVAFAYWLFAKHEVDYAVMEVGLGGLLDATNVVSREDKICVITDIGLDHNNVLGTTIEEIASQKAGIIYHKNRVFIQKQESNVIGVVKRVCQLKKARLEVVDAMRPESIVADEALFQQRNWHLARRVVEHTISQAAISSGLQEVPDVYVPGRMESIVHEHSTVVLDGSHNAQKITALVESMKHVYGGASIAILVSFGENKHMSVQESLTILRRLSDSIVVTSFSTGYGSLRPAMSPNLIACYCEAAGFSDITIIQDPVVAFRTLLSQPSDIKLVTGSFYLLNHIRPLLLKK